MMRVRALVLALIAAAGLLPWPGAAPFGAAQQTAGENEAEAPAELTSPPRALASNGAIIAMPEIAGLDCPGMAEVLGLLDESRYRGPEPVPRGHPDRKIFEYENRLAAAYYHACIMSGHRLEDPGPAFSQGFKQP